MFPLLWFLHQSFFWIFLVHPLFSAPTHNHKPQTTTGPTTQHNHHDEVWKKGIPYALGLTRSIAYRRNCFVNRNPDIVVVMTLHVGIKYKYKYLSYVRYTFSQKGLKPVSLMPRVLFYGKTVWIEQLTFWRELPGKTDRPCWLQSILHGVVML